MSQSLRTNYIFNLINTVSQVLFPLITFPYAARIMLPDGIGLVNFYTSIINYITLFSCLGIPVYAIKATASVRNNPEELNKVTIEIVSLNLILTVAAYLAVGIICLTVPKVSDNVPLFLILSLGIVFTTIGCEWFYKGIEDFKYITIRGLIVKILSIVILFCFVRTKDDILIYGLYTIIGSIGGNIFNFIRLRKYISIKECIGRIQPFRHLKPVLHVFIFSAITSIYLQLNTVILGFMKDATDVGIYTSALKLFGIVNGIIGALSTVMLPRMSNLVAEKDNAEIMRLAQKAYNFSFTFALPMIVGMIVSSPYLIHLFCGESFMASSGCVRIMAPIMLFLSISSLLGYQILYPMGHLNLVIGYCVIGSVLCVILDFLLIPKLSYTGVSISYLLTETVVAIIAVFVSRKYININFFTASQRNTIISSIVMVFFYYFIRNFELGNDMVILLFYFVSGVIVYSLSMLILKDMFFINCINSLKTLFCRS